MIRLETLLLLAGCCHFGILLASALVPGVLNWRRELASLAPLSRHVIWTHGAFIARMSLTKAWTSGLFENCCRAF